MAFVDGKLCLSQYSNQKYLKVDIEYVEVLTEIVKSHNIDIVNIYDCLEDEFYETGHKYEYINSAKGCYINFLKLNNSIILPQFELNRNAPKNSNDKNREILEDLEYDVKTIDCTWVSEMGGVLHCVSWQR